jgi:glycosyltransferase A (GT-A) superfamily protein (DUF2064 family)
MIDTLLVIAKEPVPGQVKTRLVPPLSHAQAAEVARAALTDTLRAAAAVPARRRVLALDGRAGRWLPAGWRCVPQGPGGLDVRLARAFGHARGPAILVGMDTPQLRADDLAPFDPSRHDACLGAARDGGYWALGFADPRHAAAVIPGVAMSTERTGVEQLRRLQDHGLRVQLLGELEDVDTFPVAVQVAREHPHGSFAHTVAGMADLTAQSLS